MARDGRYVYWRTESKPESGRVISRLAMNQVAFSSFDSEAGFERSCNKRKTRARKGMTSAKSVERAYARSRNEIDRGSS